MHMREQSALRRFRFTSAGWVRISIFAVAVCGILSLASDARADAVGYAIRPESHPTVQLGALRAGTGVFSPFGAEPSSTHKFGATGTVLPEPSTYFPVILITSIAFMGLRRKLGRQ
jgi:hypothetical protein